MPDRQQVSEGLLSREGVCDFKKDQDLLLPSSLAVWPALEQVVVVSDFEAGTSRR